MYLTAHRVHSRVHGRAGINAFRYLHGDARLPGMSWDVPDVGLVAQAYPGRLDLDETEVPPGGNDVLSYLDVVAADGTSAQTFRAALEQFRERVGHRATPLRETIDRVGIQFGLVLGLEGQEQREFDSLRERIWALLDTPRTAERGPTRAHPEPLVINVELTPTGYACRLDAESARRVAAQLGYDIPRERVSVETQVAQSFETLHGALTPELAQLLTRMSAAALVALGGVRFVQHDSGRVLGEWPGREGSR